MLAVKFLKGYVPGVSFSVLTNPESTEPESEREMEEWRDRGVNGEEKYYHGYRALQAKCSYASEHQMRCR